MRLKGMWFLFVPALLFAHPTPRSLLVGAALAMIGSSIRTWSAGCIHKDRVLTVTGPYAHERNPLYVGSFLIGMGAAYSAGQWYYLPIVVVFFWLAYGRTVEEEAGALLEKFGEEYTEYAASVRNFLPRLLPYRASGGRDQAGGTFSLSRYLRNREWEGLLGVVAGFGLLVTKMVWF